MFFTFLTIQGHIWYMPMKYMHPSIQPSPHTTSTKLLWKLNAHSEWPEYHKDEFNLNFFSFL